MSENSQLNSIVKEQQAGLEKQETQTTINDPSQKPETKNKFSVLKKILLFLAILLLLVTAFFSVYYFFFFEPKQQNINSETTPLTLDAQTRKLSMDEWRVVEQSAKEEFSLSNIKQVVSPSQLTNPLENNSKNAFYEDLEENYSLEPLKTVDNQQAVSQQKKAHFSFKLEAMLEDENEDKHDFELALSYLGLEDFVSQKTQVDILANLTLGDAVFKDDSMDALHVSIINAAETESVVNVEASDYFMVLLDNMLFPEKNRVPGQIYVDSSEIYPFFGNYVEIESDQVKQNEQVNQLVTDYVDFSESTFVRTFADFNKYVDTDADLILTTDESDLGVILVSINEDHLLNTIKEYFDHLNAYFKNNQSRYQQLCPNQETECLNELGYLDEKSIDTTVEAISSIFKIFRIDRSGIIVDAEDLSFKGFYLDLVQRGTMRDMLDVSIDINRLVLSFYANNPSEKQEIFNPKKTISLTDQPESLRFAAIEQGNKLYSENKAFMRTSESDILEALLVQGGEFCTTSWSPEFCINETMDWEINASSLYENTINMNYPYGNYAPDHQLSATIRSSDWEFESDCFYDEDEEDSFVFNSYEFYKDIVVNQNLNLRISLNSDGEGGYLGKVCHLKERGYNTRLPFAGEISLSVKGFTAEEALEKFSEVLSGIRIK